MDDEAHVQAVRQLIARERDFLYGGLAALNLTFVPTQTNFILLINLPREAKTINEGLLRRGLIVRPMAGFGLPEAIRVTIGRHEENEKLLEALREVVS